VSVRTRATRIIGLRRWIVALCCALPACATPVREDGESGATTACSLLSDRDRELVTAVLSLRPELTHWKNARFAWMCLDVDASTGWSDGERACLRSRLREIYDVVYTSPDDIPAAVQDRDPKADLRYLGGYVWTVKVVRRRGNEIELEIDDFEGPLFASNSTVTAHWVFDRWELTNHGGHVA
jgi:hypothetical protein